MIRSRGLVTELAELSGEASWLTSIRHDALTAFSRLPLPEWDRRTDPSAFPIGTPVPVSGNPQRDTASELAQVNSQILRTSRGVLFCDLFEATTKHATVAERYLGKVVRPDESKFISLHYALLNSGVFIYVPPYTEVAVPLRVRHAIEAEGNDSFAHTLIVVDKGARVRVVETEQSGTDFPHLAIHVVEIAAEEGASVQFVGLQDFGPKTHHFSLRRSLLSRDASIEWIVGSFGAKMSKDSTETVLQGDGSNCGNLVMSLGSGQQHVDQTVEVRHEGEHTSSDIMVRGVLQGRARGICRGMVFIEQGARFASAFQRQSAMLLSKEARADAIPELQIEEEEVQAGHAASLGQVNEDQLFYLMSRGLSRQQAIRMIVEGYLEPIFQRIPLLDVREAAQRLIDRKMNE